MTEHPIHLEDLEGNICPAKKKPRQPSPAVRWTFTWFPAEGEKTDPKIQDIYQTYCKKLVAQEEECPETGRLHVQGGLWLKEKARMGTLKTILPTAHWERMKHEGGTVKYCLKKKSRCGQQWVFGFKDDDEDRCTYEREELIDPLENKELYPWQKRIIEIAETKPDDRSIYWIVDTKGCAGKSALGRHLCLKHNATMSGGSAKDAMCGIAELVKENISFTSVIINIARSIDDAKFVSYQAIETIKDATFYSPKYKSRMCIYNYPHVFVFANFEPVYTKLTPDRWRIIHTETNTMTTFEGLDEYGACAP